MVKGTFKNLLGVETLLHTLPDPGLEEQVTAALQANAGL